MNHADLRELLGVYAVDALEGEEHEAVEEHLAGCDECRSEVAAHREAAALVASGPTEAPPELWERIRDEIDIGPERSETGRVTPLMPSARRAVRRWRVATAAGAVAAMALSVVAVNAVLDRRDLEERVDELAAAVEGSSISGAARAAQVDPTARRVTLRSPDEERIVHLVHLGDGSGFIVDDNLEPLPEGRTYQLWALSGDVAISAGVLGPSPDVEPFSAAGSIDGFAITAEQSGGVVQPSDDPLVLGFFD